MKLDTVRGLPVGTMQDGVFVPAGVVLHEAWIDKDTLRFVAWGDDTAFAVNLHKHTAVLIAVPTTAPEFIQEPTP